jgi:hypothetical protein
MKTADMVVETLAYSPLSFLTRLLAQEYFIQFGYRKNFKLYLLTLFNNDKSITSVMLFLSYVQDATLKNDDN